MDDFRGVWRRCWQTYIVLMFTPATIASMLTELLPIFLAEHTEDCATSEVQQGLPSFSRFYTVEDFFSTTGAVSSPLSVYASGLN